MLQSTSILSKKAKHPLRFGFHRPAVDDDQLSFRLSGLNLYLFLSFIVFIIGVSSYLLVRYTPFTTWVNESDKLEGKDVLALNKRLNDLQSKIEAQNTYMLTLKQRSSGETPAASVQNPIIDTIQSQYGQRIALDDSLRMRMLRNNMSTSVRTPFIFNVSEVRNFEDQLLIPPIRGSVRKTFSLADRHFGVDIIAPENSAVMATLDGLVLESDWTLEGGNTIILQHQGDLISVYKHNSALLKKKGDHVKTGEAIAIIGNTGLHSAGPHVHFELWHRGEPINPESYIELEDQQ